MPAVGRLRPTCVQLDRPTSFSQDPHSHHVSGGMRANGRLHRADVEVGFDLLAIDCENVVPLHQPGTFGFTAGPPPTNAEAFLARREDRLLPGLPNRVRAVGRAEAEAEAACRALAQAVVARAGKFVYNDVRGEQSELLDSSGVGAQVGFGEVRGVSISLTIEGPVCLGVQHRISKCKLV